MAKSKDQKEVSFTNTDLDIVFLKEWQHPAGKLRVVGSELTVEKELGELLCGEGYAEIKKN